MGALLNRARMTTATTGTGTITLGSASNGFASFAEAGATNATAYSYCIEDGNDFEIGVGTYTASGTTFSRDTVTLSKMSGTAGTTKLTLSGSATIFITARAQEIATLDAAQTYTATQTITPAANTSALVSSGGSLTGANAQSLIDLAQTWNTSGTPTAIKLNITDTASNAASALIDLQIGGSSRLKVYKTQGCVDFGPGAANGWAVSTSGATCTLGRPDGTGSIGSNVEAAEWITNGRLFGARGAFFLGTTAAARDLILERDAANVLAQRNGTNAQTFRVYNTFTDASNYERGFFRWASNNLEIGTEAAGTGTARSLLLRSGNNLQMRAGTGAWLYLGNNATDFWRLENTGIFCAEIDNSYDIGKSGANRPRNLYMASWIRFAVTTVASLPAAGTAGQGARMLVTDANATTFQSVVAGGGANIVPVYSDGTNWRIG